MFVCLGYYAIKMGKLTCRRGKNCRSNILGKGEETEFNVQTGRLFLGRSMDNPSLVRKEGRVKVHRCRGVGRCGGWRQIGENLF